jgi:MFS family permease
MPNDPDRARAVVALFVGAAMMNAAIAVTGVVGTIAVGDLLGTGWGGLPNTAAIAGTGAGALVLTRVMTARGRRAGILRGYLTATAGAGLAVAALAASRGTPGTPGGVALLVVCVLTGMVLLGLGNAAGQLSRYAAAELFPPERRGLAIGVVVWSGTVGAVGGPLLLRPAEGAAVALGGAPAAGPFALAALVTAVAALAATTLPRRRPAGDPLPGVGGRTAVRTVLASPAARTAAVVMATGQIVMVLVMTAVPLHLHHHGHGIGVVGVVLSLHTLGMFVLSPVTGRLVDAVGARRVVLGGLALLVGGAAPAGVFGGAAMLGPLLLVLGLGWNLCFVGGSAVLAREVPAAERAGVEGVVETAVWGLSGAGSLTGTALLAVGGMGTLAAVATVVAVLPLVAVPSSLPGRARSAAGETARRVAPWETVRPASRASR